MVLVANDGNGVRMTAKGDSVDELEQELHTLWDGGEFERAATLAIESYGPKTLAVLAATLRSEDDAREIFQQWSLKLWQGLPAFHWKSKIRTWAYTIAHNERINYQQKKTRQRTTRLDTYQAGKLAEQVWTRTQPYRQTAVKARFADLRNQLAEDDRELLILRVDLAMPWNEIAEVLSKPGSPVQPNTLMQRFHRIKERLKKMASEAGLI